MKNCKKCSAKMDGIYKECPNCGYSVCEECANKTYSICPNCYNDLDLKN